MAILKLVDKYSVTRLEAACLKVLSFTPNQSYKSIKTILSTGRDKLKEETVKESKEDYGFTRGAGYYRRRK